MMKKVFLGVIVSLCTVPLLASADAKNPAVLILKGKDGNKTTYYRSDVLQYKQKLPDEVRAAPDEAIFSDVRDQMLLDHLFADAINVNELENDPEVLSELKLAKLEIMKKVWMTRQLNKMVKDEDLVTSYNKVKESLVGKKVYNTAIIVVDNEAKAQEILQQAQAGKDFAELVRQHSLETSTKERGGEIGFLPEEHRARLIDSDAAKKIKVLKDGVCSNRVFQKEGKHIIIKRLGMKDAELPEYKQVVQQLKALEMQKAVGKLAKNLLDKRSKDIEVRDYNGNLDKPLKKALEAMNQSEKPAARAAEISEAAL
jgi:peptidyl-prolyl cis-trans isomerase C